MAASAKGSPTAGGGSSRLRGSGIGWLGRVYGFGSVFGKTLRDSRAALLVVAAALSALAVFGGLAVMTTYGTPAARADLAAMAANLPPILRGFYGDPLRVETLGGFLSWHYGAYFAMLAGLWSILALSSTLAGEARRGSLDLVAVTPRSRRRIASEKVAAHAVALGLASAIVALAAWATGQTLGRFEGDAIDPAAAAAFGAGVFVRSLVAGSVAFAIAPLLGRGPAAGIAGAVMLGGYVVHTYRAVVPAFELVSKATWFGWTAGHVPLAGGWDWPAFLLTGAVAALLLWAGVEAFARRDIGVSIALPLPAASDALVGTRGPVRRTFGDLLPTTLAWGVGLGGYGFIVTASAGAIAELLAATPEVLAAIQRYIPDLDITTSAGLLQFAFVDLGFILVGLATASLIGLRCGDEVAGRLELPLTTPLSRLRWALASGAAVGLAILLIVVVLAAMIGAGALAQGESPVQPIAGTLVLALYGWALAGLGLAVAGVAGPRWATAAVVAVALVTSLVDLFGPLLGLSDWVEALALTNHFGRSMIGAWDPVGIGASLALAMIGALVGAWGMTRRDIGR
jgi:ABC-2 type transport system permease protein